MEQSYRKGFTLVELAIVLVIIGLIMGMAIKGKSLIQIARMRAEVNKINKFEAAIATYYARIGKLSNFVIAPPTAQNAPVFDNNVLLSMGLLKDTDLTSIPHSSRNNNPYPRQWSFFYCSRAMGFAGGVVIYRLVVGLPSGDLCATNTPIGANGLPISHVSSLSTQLVCSIEVIKDDASATTGTGMFADGSNSDYKYFETPNVFDDCFAIPDSQASESYVYKVF